MKNYYQVLQVDPSAEQEVIEAAFKRLASKYHPDKNKASDATAKMQELNEAYDTLRNVEKRKQYDNDIKPKPVKEPAKPSKPSAEPPKAASPPSKPQPKKDESWRTSTPLTDYIASVTQQPPPFEIKTKSKPKIESKVKAPFGFPEGEKGGFDIQIFGTRYRFTNNQWGNIGLVAGGVLFIILILFMVFLYYYVKAPS